MDLVLGGLRWSVCLVYLDDIIVYARNTEKHRQRLVMVLSALRKANLKLKLGKCRFEEKEITALGHRISAEGVRRPNPENLKAVKELPQLPTSGKRANLVKWVKSFLGLVSYYRRVFPGFEEVAKPLIDLTKDRTLFIWGTPHQKSFDELKERLANVAVLAYPEYCQEF